MTSGKYVPTQILALWSAMFAEAPCALLTAVRVLGAVLSQFVTLMAHQMRSGGDASASVKAAFSIFDADGSGQIDREEIRGMMREMGECNMGEEDFEKVLKDMDLDGDGQISYDEFSVVLTRELNENGFRLT